MKIAEQYKYYFFEQSRVFSGIREILYFFGAKSKLMGYNGRYDERSIIGH